MEWRDQRAKCARITAQTPKHELRYERTPGAKLRRCGAAPAVRSTRQNQQQSLCGGGDSGADAGESECSFGGTQRAWRLGRQHICSIAGCVRGIIVTSISYGSPPHGQFERVPSPWPFLRTGFVPWEHFPVEQHFSLVVLSAALFTVLFTADLQLLQPFTVADFAAQTSVFAVAAQQHLPAVREAAVQQQSFAHPVFPDRK